jgi:predicted RNase H-like HicB family nuclease
MKVTATAHRSGDWWAIEVPEVRGVHTQVKRLDQAAAMAADAVALMLEIDPADIDEAYIDLVTNELFAIESDVLRDIMGRPAGEEAMTEAESERLRAVLAGDVLLDVGQSYVALSTSDRTRPAFLSADEMGTLHWETAHVVDASHDCIVAIGHYDISEVAVEPYGPDEFSMISLSPDADLEEINPTPWRLRGQLPLVSEDGDPIPEDGWDRINYEAVLDNTCNGGND